jgi:hypothetical protein
MSQVSVEKVSDIAPFDLKATPLVKLEDCGPGCRLLSCIILKHAAARALTIVVTHQSE